MNIKIDYLKILDKGFNANSFVVETNHTMGFTMFFVILNITSSGDKWEVKIQFVVIL